MKKVQLLTSFFSFNIGTFIQLWAARSQSDKCTDVKVSYH